MLQCFTTTSSNRAERSQQWRALTRADHVLFGDNRQASLRGGDFGNLRLCHASMGAHCLRQMASKKTLEAPTLKIFFQEEGAATIRQDGRQTLLTPGQWLALRKDRPYEIEATAPSRQLCVTLPCALLGAVQAGDDWRNRPHSFQAGPAQVLHASAAASVLAGKSLTKGDRIDLGEQLARMVAMTVRHDERSLICDVREERRRAILEYIDQHLEQPELSVETIAASFDCSVRTIHNLFRGEAQTVSRLIWKRRLERCRTDMLDRSIRHRSITEIAHFWGFSDSQHFSRSFKNQFGMAPRDYRALHRLN